MHVKTQYSDKEKDQITRRVLQLVQDGMSLRGACREVGVNSHTVDYWIKTRPAVLPNVAEILDENRTRYTNTFVHIDNNADIAYLLGLYLSDAWITQDDYRRQWKLQITAMDKDIVQRFIECGQRLFGKKNKLQSRSGSGKYRNKMYYGSAIYSRSLCQWLDNITDGKMMLPDFIFSESREWQLKLLAGILDGDGFVTFSENRYRTKNGKSPTWYCQIGICGLAESYMKDLARLLDKMKIRYRINHQPPRKEGYQPQVRILIDPVDFLTNGLYFLCERKAKKVSLYRDYILLQRSETMRPPGHPRKGWNIPDDVAQMI